MKNWLKKIKEIKIDWIVAVKDLFTASFIILIVSIIIEQRFCGFMITFVGLSFWLVVTFILGVTCLYLVNKK